MTPDDPDYSEEDPCFAPEAFKWGITQEEIEEVLLYGKPIPMKKNQRGNECTMVVGHCSTRVELIEVAVEIRNKIWTKITCGYFMPDRQACCRRNTLGRDENNER